MRAVEIARAKRARLATELQKLDDFLAMAEALEQEAAPEANLVEDLVPSPHNSARLGSIRQRVEEAVTAELTQFGARSTKELLEALQAKGIDPAPRADDFNDKRNVLSTMLSKAKHLFTNDREARAWKLKKALALLELTKAVEARDASIREPMRSGP
jgi:hypothetical protein